MKRIFTGLICMFAAATLWAQDMESQKSANESIYATPKLVVGVVVDQMRYDYITRFWPRYGEDGFKKLIRDGFHLKNNHFNYIPTFTGPGHASVYTGSAPETHGIISNSWYNKFERDYVYCAGDAEAKSVGTSSDAGKMSPHRMLTTSVADENRLHTQMRGKTIGVAIKDRGSILPAGHTANGAYWFHGGDEGHWITSSFYMEELPEWVKDFNRSKKAESYMKTWNTLYDIESYVESGSDLNTYEGGFRGKETATFPYDLEKLSKENGGFNIIESTPFGNSLTADFAIAAIEGEDLGQDEITDFLTVSFSSTDYVGHNFGVNSVEVQDTYLRLDQDLARLINALDEKVGAGNYTLFLTSDHGAIHVPNYLSDQQIPAGYFDNNTFETALKNFVAEEFGSADAILNISNDQVFFDYEFLFNNDIDADELEEAVAHFVLQYDQVNMVYTRSQMEGASYLSGISSLLDHGFHQKRSGDVLIVLEPSIGDYAPTGSTHGTGLNFDTHAPLIFYGNGIKQGSSYERTEIVDIAPTISALLGIPFPNGSTGRPLEMVLEK